MYSATNIEKQENNLSNTMKHVFTFKTVQMKNEIHMFQKVFTKAEIATLTSLDAQEIAISNISFNSGLFADTKNEFSVKFISFVNKRYPNFIKLEVEGIFHSKIKLMELRYTVLSLDMCSDILTDEGTTPRSMTLQSIETRNEQMQVRHSARYSDMFEEDKSVFRLWLVIYTSHDARQGFLGGFSSTDYEFSRKHFQESKFFDVGIVVDDEIFPAHRMILSERSSVFQRMFETDMVENINGIIKIDDFNAVVVKEFLQFLYTGSCKALETAGNKISQESVDTIMELFEMSDKYNVEHLKYVCIFKLRGAINVGNAVQIYTAAYLHNSKWLESEARTIFQIHKQEIVPDLASVNELMKNYHPKAIYNLLIKQDSKCFRKNETDNTNDCIIHATNSTSSIISDQPNYYPVANMNKHRAIIHHLQRESEQ